jgi:ATP-dependent Clp protease adaptor protein ClpS
LSRKHSESAVPALDAEEVTEAEIGGSVRLLPPYNVILLNDNDHTYTYVVEMLRSLFGTQPERAWQMAKEVDKTGRAIVCTTSKERAELKRDQIHAFGPDPSNPRCAGSMSAVIEPAYQPK